MNAWEAEILELTKYKPLKIYKSRDEYLINLLKAVDAFPQDRFEHLVSNQVFQWYEEAARAFKNYKPLPELPNVSLEDLRYLRDDEDYITEHPEVITPEEHRGNIKALIDAHEEADKALEKLQEATEKVKPKRQSKYRQPHPAEGARHYLFPEADRYGLQKGSVRQ